MKPHLSRRGFLQRSAMAGAAGLLLPSSRCAFGSSANEKVNVAIVGVGGRGRWFVDTMPKLANVVALCDVNDQRAGDAYQKLPKARKFYDFRRMLEAMEDEIDGVIVATPDNTHAVIASMAMRMGKHVYCEKPLTRTIHEARHLMTLARRHKVATQMGNQGTASEAFRRAYDTVRSGALGEIREVYAWNDSGGAGTRPVPQGRGEVPDHLKWDLWLGPARDRPYHPDWMRWHTWRDFATGQLGNWAVHTTNLAFKALKLHELWDPSRDPSEREVRLQSRVGAHQPSTFPRWEIVQYDFPRRGQMPPLRLEWHNGRSGPEARAKIEKLLGRKLDWGDAGEKKWRDHAGLLLIGSKGKLHANGHNTVVTLLPRETFEDYAAPERTLPRSPGHEREWLAAIQGGPPAMSHFDYGAPLTEFVLLGNVATLFPEVPLVYDPAQIEMINHSGATEALHRDYREGWML